jgi:hypothetical protein
MSAMKRICVYVPFLILTVSLYALAENAQTAPAQRDGQHDFDFEIGTWKTHLSRLLHPLTGSKTWVEYNGTTVVPQFGTAAPILWSSKSTVRKVISKD